MKEQWRVFALADRYEANNLGHIRNKITKHLITPSFTHDKYLRVTLRVGHPAKMKNFTLHKVVMWCFRGPRPKDKEVDHKDRNKLNCALSNLRYVMPDFNKRQRVMERGEARHCAKLTESKVMEILLNPDVSLTEFANRLGCDRSLISRIRRRTAWKHVHIVKDKGEVVKI